MSGQHKKPTISFRVSDSERAQIEANIKASGMSKQNYFVKSAIYNRVCVVGKKETIYPLVANYYEKVANDKKKDMAVELIFQLGDKDYWDKHYDKRRDMDLIFTKILEKLQEETPELVVANAVII